jgi:hypothetical protein
MNQPTLSGRQLARLSALVTAAAKKQKTSVTLSDSLLTVVDALAGPTRRSAWIEAAVRRYALRELRRRRRLRELELLNRHADALNAEGDDSAAFQAPWDGE